MYFCWNAKATHIFFSKNISVYAMFNDAKATHIFFSKNIYSVYAMFNDQSFNDTLTNDNDSFEQLGPV